MDASKSLAKASVAIEPSQCAFDNSVARQDFKADDVGHASHDLDAPVAEFGERPGKLIACIGTVGADQRGSTKSRAANLTALILAVTFP